MSWYEAVAFCRWMSEALGERILLPTEAQWQYAAQGGDGRAYPWGEKWDGTRCNNSVVGLLGFLRSKPPGHGERTTPVTAYEGRGDSPFGVADMVGNVWEWCLTDYYDGTNDPSKSSNNRVLRGGSWDYEDTGHFRCVSRSWGLLVWGIINRGFALPSLESLLNF
ncbi:MAG: SUMF1/EgtB/PvdO family nonheme iron enzyme [Chloroflexi bacterium]|nr:SUMF1/EgtB/PvdO family nonheme iron enzyme [Chloroflexota bacterium]